MANKSTPVEKAARLLDLVPYISTHQGISLKKLASDFGVSTEEIISDLNTLWMCGLPGYTPLELIDLEFESGFVSIRNAETLNIPRTLSQQEIISILIGIDIVKESLTNDSSVQADIASLEDTLKNLVGDVVVASHPTNSTVRATIANAIRTRQRIDIKYLSGIEDQVSERIISPLDLYVDGTKEYLLGFCHSANSQRTFRLDRIQSAELIHETAHSGKVEGSSEPFTYTISIRRDLRLHSENFALDDASIGSESEIHAFQEEWVLRSVISAAGGVVLKTPSGTRASIKKVASEILASYR